MLIVIIRGLAMVALVATLTGCAAGPVNPRLDAYGPDGYRYAKVRGEGAEQELFVILAFSGGGTRAAAFSYGLLEGLQSITYRPPPDATDMTLGARFEFTQDQFDLLCSDLSQVPVARAVAASSAFPILLSPLTLHNYGGDHCDPDRFLPPTWLKSASEPSNPPRRQALARNLMSYRQDLKDRPFVHLLDGGLADNIGLRGPYIALSGQAGAWSAC